MRVSTVARFKISSRLGLRFSIINGYFAGLARLATSSFRTPPSPVFRVRVTDLSLGNERSAKLWERTGHEPKD